MIVLALDTTTRAGSAALRRDGTLVEVFVGDASRTHATRLPGDLTALLDRHGLSLRDVDLFAVAAGPGSFTGLRIGIATIQGLAFANEKPVVAVSALEALAHAAADALAGREPQLVGAWMDAQRHEVYAELYRPAARQESRFDVIRPAAVGEAAQIVDAWREAVAASGGENLFVLAGDGVLAYRSAAEQAFPRATVLEPVPPLASAIARIGEDRARLGLAGPPHAIRPVYVRRPDAELARDRRALSAPPAGAANRPPAEDLHRA